MDHPELKEQAATEPDAPFSSGTRLQRGMARAPIAVVVVVLGVSLSVFAWLGLRAVEKTEANVTYERILLAQSSELQGALQGYIDAMDGLGSTLGASSATPSVGGLRSQVSRFEPLAQRQAISGLALFEIVRDSEDEQRLLDREVLYANTTFADSYDGESSARPNVVLTRLYGVNGADDLLGQDLGTQTEMRQLLQSASFTDRTLVGTTAVAFAIFEQIGDASAQVDRPGVVLVTPIRHSVLGDERNELNDVDALLIGRLYLDQVFAGMSSMEAGQPVALELSADQLPLASTMAPTERGASFGEPVVFTEGEVTWSIQGYEAGLLVDHRGSWVALITGLVLAMTGGLFSASARRHAITMGRLERSEFDARHDLLTGLYNRAGLTEILERRLNDRRERKLVSVLFLDLDRLKVVNDSIGHSAGDEVLNHVARRLEGILRDGDIVGRFGGDEFVVVAAGLQSVGDALALSARILDSFREPAILSDESSQVISTSIGIAVHDGTAGTDATAESLLRDADLAMYRAKEAGGSRAEIFDNELRAQALARLEVERELRRAIRTGQIVVHFQPIVDVTTGIVDRLEALVRWKHPERGMVPPGQFLSVAAESGLIVDVGEHVLREACRQAAQWQQALGRPIMVSVNVAERQLLDTGFISTVTRVLAETGIAPSQLELELTEELIVERLDHRLTILRELVAMGIQLAIDDFGTSRASLSQLKSLDMVSTLKIDRAFVVDVASDSVDRKIITAIVALADSVGMEVVAEGVESADQVVALRELGVDLIQGFYFHRPAPTENIIGLLQRPFEIPTRANTAPPEPT